MLISFPLSYLSNFFILKYLCLYNLLVRAKHDAVSPNTTIITAKKKVSIHEICLVYTQKFNIYLYVIFNNLHGPSECIFFQEEDF